jgi:hypothetical protein
LDDPVFNCSIPYANLKPLIMKYILKRWQDSWDRQIYNKLHEIHSLVGKASYRIIQCVLGFLVNDCVPMNTYLYD